MKTQPDDPAFTSYQDYDGGYKLGLTKREYFAAMAMQGLLSAPPADTPMPDLEEDASLAVDAAEYLIRRLNITEGKTPSEDYGL